MTREEAIKILKDTLYDEKTPTDYLEAVKMGREALENQTSVIQELEKIKAEIIACTQQEEGEVPACINYGIKLSTEIVEKHIAELKGE